MLVRLENVSKEYSGQALFEGIVAQCNPGDHIALIGRNGTGKTTLFNLIDGTTVPDTGTITRASRLSISRVDQIPVLDSDRTVCEEALIVFDNLKRIEARLEELEHLIAGGGHESDEIAGEYEELRARFELDGGYDYPSRTEKVLHGIGFKQEDLNLLCSHLSGGQQSRVALARTLLRPAELLLLDEPTNHLDLNGILWLTNFLKEQKRAFILISHERRLLDQVTGLTWEFESGTLFTYSVPFTHSRKVREERRRLQQKEYERQQEWKRKTEDYIRRNIAGQKTRQAQSRRKQLAKTRFIEKPRTENGERRTVHAQLAMRIASAQRGGSVSFSLENGTIGFPGTILIEKVDLNVRRGDRIGILGGNGSGKSTLLRSLLGEIRLLEGRMEWGHNAVPSYFAQEAIAGRPEQTVLDCLAEISPGSTDLELRKFGARFLFRGEDIEKRVSQLSGGERSRLSLARLFSTPSNILFLDEPTNHLDIRSREALESAINGFEGSVIVVSHDLYFLDNVVDQFYLIWNHSLIQLDDLGGVGTGDWGRVTGDSGLVTGDPGPFIRAPKVSEEPRKVGSTRSDFRMGNSLSKNEQLRLKWKLEETETQIAELESRKAAIEQQLASTQNHKKLAELGQEHDEIEEELEKLLTDWETLSQTLD
jgi:ATP-binding cassette subfamily F protein 3